MKLLIILFMVVISLAATQKLQAGNKYEKATFAGGCFWCMEPPFKKLSGVIEVYSGYTGGHKVNPTYEEVSSGESGHVEAIQVVYDPAKVSYDQLLDLFWRQINPTDPAGQFVDRGPQYRSAIYYHSDTQKKLAEASRNSLNKSGKFPKPVVTEIIMASDFYKAEDYHQDYYKKNPVRYKFYRSGSGRDQYLFSIWGDSMAVKKEDARAYKKPDMETLKKKLTPIQYKVTQEDGTETPFANEYWDNKREGIYVDIVSGEPLFSSLDKFDSGTGWPSFMRPLEPNNIIEKEDRGFSMARIEIRSKLGNSHIGHLFNDGPKPTGLRYCMNSAALRFISREDLDKKGYGKYKRLFGK